VEVVFALASDVFMVDIEIPPCAAHEHTDQYSEDLNTGHVW
jgi:hypothetical protein